MPPPGSRGALQDPGHEPREGDGVKAGKQVGGRVESRLVLAAQPKEVKERPEEAVWELAGGLAWPLENGSMCGDFPPT